MTPDLSLFDLSGRTALVTGGAAGIGRAAAFALAGAGAGVAVADVDETGARRTAEELEAAGHEALFVRCDVREPADVDAMVHAVAQRFGRLDVAVNNAGIFCGDPDDAQSLEDWQRVVDVNLTGTWLCARAEMRHMRGQDPVGGKIVNVASIAATIAASTGSYDASKAAVVHLTRTLAARWGGHGINVNSISPGYVDTVFGATRSPDEQQRLGAVIPLGRVQRLDDLAGAFVFLASRASDYVTGQNLVVDGGHTLSTWVVPPQRSVPRVPDA